MTNDANIRPYTVCSTVVSADRLVEELYMTADDP
jgi:hypothetical protein